MLLRHPRSQLELYSGGLKNPPWLKAGGGEDEDPEEASLVKCSYPWLKCSSEFRIRGGKVPVEGFPDVQTRTRGGLVWRRERWDANVGKEVHKRVLNLWPLKEAGSKVACRQCKLGSSAKLPELLYDGGAR